MAWIIDASVHAFGPDFEVDATNGTTGLVFRWPRNPEDADSIFKGEFFSGGFSGWTQVADFLTSHSMPVVSTFALDHDRIAAVTFAENYGDGEVERCASEAIHHERTSFLSSGSTRVFQCDIASGWWMQFAVPVDVLVMSPPCPAWSLANIAHGLNRDDGFVTVESLLRATMLQPNVIGFENVANFASHVHHRIIRDLLEWLGWRCKWTTKSNLLDVLPLRIGKDSLLSLSGRKRIRNHSSSLSTGIRKKDYRLVKLTFYDRLNVCHTNGPQSFRLIS